jgi:glycosyltransferase involved in cell wall biosynthesis
MTKISAIILTFNEEENIKEVLETVSFADEIIVLDSISTDQTKALALANKNIQFFERKFDNYTSQRNYALDLAKNDWILFLDADERILPNLKNEITKAVENIEFVPTPSAAPPPPTDILYVRPLVITKLLPC